MESYFYTKALNSEVLSEAINIRTSLRSVYDGCSYTTNSDGSVDTDNVELKFSRALISSEIDEITNVINAIGPAYDLVIRKHIENHTMNWALNQGQTLLAQFGANNLYAQKTPVQVEALATQYPELIHSLITGSLTVAYGIFITMQPDANFTQNEIDEFIIRMKIILDIP